MSHSIENGILVHCDECIVDIEKRIKEKKPFIVKEIRKSIEDSRKETLKYIISTLYYSNNCIDTPQACRGKITQSLIEHGQFNKEEIDEIFNQYSYESTNYTNGFISNHPEIDFVELVVKRFAEVEKVEEIVEVNYNFPFPDCSYSTFLGFCRMNIETLKCPDCGGEVTNTPDNVSFGYEKNLLCPVCQNKREDEFDNKGLIKAGNPKHHGYWHSQEPELIYTGTDYFAVFHPKCAKSKRDDKKGFMEVNGVWVDDSGRVVLSLECIYCGARNALKPFTKRGGFPLLNESGAEWKRVESPILEIIEKGENDKVEFKSSLRWDYEEQRVNKQLEYEVARSISGFLNTRGGILLIGVDNYKNVLGIEKDCSTLGKGRKNSDGFELQLTEIINRYIGKGYGNFIKIAFESAHKKEIGYVEITKSSKPCFLIKNRNKEFVNRSGNRTQSLDVQETAEYIKINW